MACSVCRNTENGTNKDDMTPTILTHIKLHIIVCKIYMNHVFFRTSKTRNYFKYFESITVLLKQPDS